MAPLRAAARSLVVLAVIAPGCLALVPSSRGARRQRHVVLGAEEDRSETVKRLNDLFYQATEEESVPDDPLADLPLWRVQWNALPGVRQVYNVHVPHYTAL